MRNEKWIQGTRKKKVSIHWLFTGTTKHTLRTYIDIRRRRYCLQCAAKAQDLCSQCTASRPLLTVLPIDTVAASRDSWSSDTGLFISSRNEACLSLVRGGRGGAGGRNRIEQAFMFLPQANLSYLHISSPPIHCHVDLSLWAGTLREKCTHWWNGSRHCCISTVRRPTFQKFIWQYNSPGADDRPSLSPEDCTEKDSQQNGKSGPSVARLRLQNWHKNGLKS